MSDAARPLVSVILSTYNQASYLDEAIESALGQTYPHVELIVVDNGSQDETPSVLARRRDDNRIQVMAFAENESISRRFNQAIKASRGEFVSILYGDDMLMPEKLELQVRAFEAGSVETGVVYGTAVGLNELTGDRFEHQTLRSSGRVFDEMLTRGHVAAIDMATPLTRKECFVAHPFDEAIFAETEAIFFRVALTHEFQFVDAPLVVLRDHGGNAGKATERNLQQLQLALVNLRRNPHLEPSQLELIDGYESALLRSRGWSGIRIGADPKWARSKFIESCRLSTRSAIHPKTATGIALSVMPSPIRSRINRLGHRIGRSRSNPSYVTDYIGSSTQA